MSAENNEGSAEQAPNPSGARSFGKLLLFLFFLVLPWMVMLVLPRLANVVYWPSEIISHNTAHQLRRVALFAFFSAYWASLAAIPAFLLALLVSIPSRAHKRKCLFSGLLCASTILAAWTGFPRAFASLLNGRSHALDMVVLRGQPIIDALDKWHEDKGGYPASLPEIVPRYLGTIPGTGIAGYPDFQYKQLGAETPYELFVNLEAAGSRSDESYPPRCYYWPTNRDKYHTGKFGRTLDDWAYSSE